jgi:squalene-hopene/tetraprenyl-beta-curcumene cyclase
MIRWTAALALALAAAAGDPKEARVAAYDRGLDFLRSKAVEGKWGPPGRADAGMTALVLTAFMERPGGPTEKDRPAVDAAFAWLKSLQKPDGGIYEGGQANYSTSLAIQAFVLSGRKDLKEAADRAVAYIRKNQYGEDGGKGLVVGKADLRYGGQGYGTWDEADDEGVADLSNTTFALESLKAAGVPESDPAFQRALAFVRRVQNRRENETEGEVKELKDKDGKVYVRGSDGGAHYRPFESKAGTVARPDGKLEVRSYGSMTYAMLKCYAFAGLKATDPAVADAVKWIRAHYTWEENPGFTDPKLAQQGLFYYYATAARAMDLLGDDAAGKDRDWRGDLAAKLLGLQKADGSWVNANDRWMEGLPEISTAFALKALARTVK